MIGKVSYNEALDLSSTLQRRSPVLSIQLSTPSLLGLPYQLPIFVTVGSQILLIILPIPKTADQPCTISIYSGLMASKTSSAMVSKLEWPSQMPRAIGGKAALFSMFAYAVNSIYSHNYHSCQCGISRSATMVIAIVMRAAAEHAAWVPQEIWALKGMQAAYSFVKEKSPCVGPNMSYAIHRIFFYIINLCLTPVLSIN